MKRPPQDSKKKKSGDAGERPDLFGNAVSEPHSTPTIRFAGTDNPRHLRALNALLIRPVPRNSLDEVVGCANGPDLVADIRDLGLGRDGLKCTHISVIDRDGKKVRPGVYHLTDAGRRAVTAWLRKRDREAGE